MKILNFGSYQIFFSVFRPRTSRLGAADPGNAVGQQSVDVDTAECRSVLLEFRSALSQLAVGSAPVPVAGVIQSDGKLNQSLEKKPVGTAGSAPQIFQNVMAFEIMPGIE